MIEFIAVSSIVVFVALSALGFVFLGMILIAGWVVAIVVSAISFRDKCNQWYDKQEAHRIFILNNEEESKNILKAS